tara:strand:+ start:659 stop:1033 length:375 start_codon:yes stop_codon:yes gene_type:complete
MNKNEFTTKGARVVMNGKVGTVMKALPYKTVVDFDSQERWEHLRHNQNDMRQLLPLVESDAKTEYSEVVRKAVNVLNAPKGTINAKMDYIVSKVMAEGYTNQEATTVFLEALNIASNGELLASV